MTRSAPGELFEGLFHGSIAVSRLWRSQVVTTEPPKLIPHTEWKLEVLFVASEPVLPVLRLDVDGRAFWARSDRTWASTEVSVQLNFMPEDVRRSDIVFVALAAQDPRGVTAVQHAIAAPRLVRDPRSDTELHLANNARVPAGSALRVATITGQDVSLTADVALIALRDTASARLGRWGLRRTLSAPTDWSFLASGRRAGAS